MRQLDATEYRAGEAICLAFALDTLLAEPPARIHPVALFGRLVAPIDREWRFPHAVGACAVATLPLAAAGVAAGAVTVADRLPISPTTIATADTAAGRRRCSLTSDTPSIPGTLLAAGVLFATTSRRMLTGTARSVVADSEHALPRARRELRALAGRDSSELSAGQVRSAAVESTSENLSDGFLAPLLAFALFAPRSLPAAAGASAWVKAVNTMDSMLGYRSVPTGWAPARLDDLIMWLPARLTAVPLAFAAGDPTALRRAAAWADEPSSPNAGWPMATLAALLDVRLEKPGAYVLAPSKDLPTVAKANAGIAVVERGALLAVLAACLVVAIAPANEKDRSAPSSADDRHDASRDGQREASRSVLSSLSGGWSARIRTFLRRWLPWS
ncbi:CobD/CbiB family cobalamin biosynthesis protein [Halobacteriales archaeon QS_3_64_16]|nr:MAG: CobD/CbiB family cobalamin biosynthesis protein [Halobacteriales archaeon QS_3_64_16]